MKTIHYAIGLPRSGSTLLMNILQQNPDIFTSSTCPTTYLLEGAKRAAGNVAEFIAMDQDQMHSSLTNYVKYGIDTRKQSISTMASVVDRMRKQLDKQMNLLSKDEDTIRELDRKQVLLKEAIEKTENNKEYIENELSILKQDYESTITGVKDKNDTTRVEIDKDLANRLQLVENVIDANYLKLMKNVVDKGCS